MHVSLLFLFLSEYQFSYLKRKKGNGGGEERKLLLLFILLACIFRRVCHYMPMAEMKGGRIKFCLNILEKLTK